MKSNRKLPAPKKDIVVIYHANCTDGFTGAWAAWKKFGEKAEYLSWSHHAPLKPYKNKELYFIDIVPNEEEIKKLLAANRRVTAIDHHISSEAAVKMTDRYSFALDHSGAMLAWKYFHPDKAVPKLVRYVEDGDLWTKKMKNTPAVYAYMNLFDFSFRNFSKLAREFDKKSLEKKHIKVGKLLLAYEKKLIAKIVSLTAVPVEFFGIRALAVNSPVFASEIGEVLYNKKPPLAIIWYEREGQLKISLRSNGKVDVAKLAEKFGGGGHKAAAAFTIAANRGIPWKRL